MIRYNKKGKKITHKKAIIATVGMYAAIAFVVGLFIKWPEYVLAGLVLVCMVSLIGFLAVALVIKTYFMFAHKLRDFKE